MTEPTSRRRFLKTCTAAAGAGLLQACGTAPASNNAPSALSYPVAKARTVYPKPPRHSNSADNLLRIVASSGFAEDINRVNTALTRLYNAGFTVTNQQAGSRRFQRFAGTDAQRAADFQEVASGRVAMPKVLMGLRGGYGAARILPHIDFASLGARMREHGTLFFGFSDVCAVQLALLAKGNMMSFAGPMAYSDFGKPAPGAFTMDAFIKGVTQRSLTVDIPYIQRADIETEGTLWGGNLSVLASLAGTPYMPDIDGGILFLEDVGEQPYRIERMLNTLYLSGILKKQRAIIFGNFRMGNIRDVYDSSYDFSTVVNHISRTAKIPVLTGFPFGHIADKITFPLGAHAKVRSRSDGGYSVAFAGYPTLDASALTLDTLLPPPDLPIFPESGVADISE
ncbi:LD-carboxypeptidase [Neisseria polysaccharea]|uniref:LD-carboxypeptidase n=1 Tax=Neisseria polysaccharea TaxID=489 RepID=UPI0001D9D825|nr:LD-carboxypeptidase [Neisseria polysaccharea]EFH21819.1 Tat pathway signal sequence domain protein [Neisseria polysaccharea ATCC 43768]